MACQEETSHSSHLASQPSLASLQSLTSQTLHHHHYYCLTTLKGHTSYIFSLTLAGNFLYSGSSDQQIRSWNQPPFTNTANNIIAVGKTAVKSLLVLSNKLLISAHQDHKIRVWKIDHHQKYQHFATLPTLTDRACKLLSLKTRVQIRRHKKCTWVHHNDAVSALAISNDESLLYSVSWDRTIKIWRTNDFRCLDSVMNAHDDAINAIVLSKDGFVYTGSTDTKIKVWRKNSGEKKHFLVSVLERHKSGINALALSDDDSVLYSGAGDRSIVVWEKEGSAGQMVVVGALRGHMKAILCLATVSDMVVSGSADKTVRIWRRGVDGRYSCLAVMEGHGGPVKCLTAAVDYSDAESSLLVYSGSLDCDIKVWKIYVHFS